MGTVGNVGEKVFIDLVSFSETVRKNHYYHQRKLVQHGKSLNSRTFQTVCSTKPDTLGQRQRVYQPTMERVVSRNYIPRQHHIIHH